MTGQKKTRRELLESFVAQKPDDAFSRYGLAMECVNSGDSAAAEANFRELLQRNGDYVPAYLMFAQIHELEHGGVAVGSGQLHQFMLGAGLDQTSLFQDQDDIP